MSEPKRNLFYGKKRNRMLLKKKVSLRTVGFLRQFTTQISPFLNKFKEIMFFFHRKYVKNSFFSGLFFKFDIDAIFIQN